MSDNEPILHTQLLPCTADAPGSARDSAAGLLAELGHGAERSDDLLLAVSELVTNAVVHGAGGDLELRLQASPLMIRVEVSDAGTSAFEWPADGVNGVNGHWGLGLVKAFSERCGVLRLPSTRVWCELDLA